MCQLNLTLSVCVIRVLWTILAFDIFLCVHVQWGAAAICRCISIALVAPKTFHFGYIQHYASHLTWEAIVIKYIRLIFLRKGSQVEIQSRQTPWKCWIIADQKSFSIWKSQKHGMLKAFRVYEIFSSDNLKIIKLRNLKFGEPKFLKFDIF